MKLYLSIIYESSDDVGYVFRISTKPDSAKEAIQKFRSEDGNRLSENINKVTNDIKIYSYTKTKEEEIDDPAQIFSMDVHGVAVNVRIFNEPDLAVNSKALQNVKFLRLDEILQLQETESTKDEITTYENTNDEPQ